MSLQYEDCLKKGSIKAFSRGKAIAGKELETAEEDLGSAKKSFESGNYKWATIQVYYSMFHSARALLYAKNFKEHSHACLILAVRKFYVNEGKIPAKLVDALQDAKGLREDADYYSRWSKESAGSLLKLAEEFLNKAKEII
ncbi:MAG: HEPN domain-containing protein [Elusimicrobiota bacterium]